jgi:3,5-epimerase/4-reductase
MIIVIGKSGHLRTAYQHYFQRNKIPHLCLGRTEINPSDPSAIKILLKSLKPSFLINAAGYTGQPNVDACENNQDSCLLANLILPIALNQVCQDLHLP